ncbi:unnamed protein product, partial [Owenia fusiformis]
VAAAAAAAAASRYSSGVECLKLLIESGIDVNVQNNNGDNALIVAADAAASWDSYGVECLKLLIESGIDVNVKNNNGDNALIVAAAAAAASRYSSGVECLKLLIESGIDVNVQNNNGDNALIVAADAAASWDSYGVRCLKLLIESGIDVNVQNNNGDNALIVAAAAAASRYSYGVECLKLLIESGVNVNISTYADKTALSIAISTFNPKIIETLLNHDADVNVNKHETWHLAFQECKKHLPESKTPLMQFLKHAKYSDIVKKLIELDEELHSTDEHGKTALMYASWFDQCYAVRMLVEAGVNVNVHDRDRITALMFACMNGCETCCSTLVHAGGHINAREKHGRTALFLTKIKPGLSTLNIYEELLIHGAHFGLENLNAVLSEKFMESIETFPCTTLSIIYDMLLRFEYVGCTQDIMFRVKQSQPETSSLFKDCMKSNTEVKATWLHKYSALAARSCVKYKGDIDKFPTARKLKVYISCMGCKYLIKSAEALYPSPDEKSDKDNVDMYGKDECIDTDNNQNDTDDSIDHDRDRILNKEHRTNHENDSDNYGNDTENSNSSLSIYDSDSEENDTHEDNRPQYVVVPDASDFSDMESVEDDWYMEDD